jgi:hypothetical protein
VDLFILADNFKKDVIFFNHDLCGTPSDISRNPVEKPWYRLTELKVNPQFTGMFLSTLFHCCRFLGPYNLNAILQTLKCLRFKEKVETLLDVVWCIVSDYRPGDGVRSPAEARDFSSSLCVQTRSGAHPAFCLIGTGGKARPGRDADH